ncbi:MAG TPA: RodZ domain-containing protein [Desulfobacteria bacterium]|nr:RodZ domain-containing protein [Desulfobacteria bacterium]
MQSIGDTLREAREQKGLTIRDLEEMTKIRTHYLKALEEERFEQLPGKTYVIGFLRSYARALGLNAQEIVDIYKETGEKSTFKPVDITPAAEPSVATLVKRSQPLPRWVVIAALCVLAILTLYGVRSFSQGSTKAPSGQANNTPASLTTGNSISTGNAGGQAANQVTSPNSSVSATTPDTATADTAQSKKLTMELTFTNRCWLQVEADGQMVINGTMNSGDKQTITANNQIKFVSVGKPDAVQVVLNGKSLGPLGPVGPVLQNKVFTLQDVSQ